MQSGLYESLIQKEKIVAHKELERNNNHLIIEPAIIPFISYPYEWCFSQLKDAALLTLELQKEALAHEMILKDATAFNVQFHKGQAIFIDTTSFETYEKGQPWAAYRQFCQHFLIPLVLMSHVDPALNQLSSRFLDGIPLSVGAKLLPLSAKLSLTNLLHIVLHQKTSQKHETTEPSQENNAHKKAPSISKNSLLGLIDQLEGYISKLDLKMKKSEWLNYYNETNYDEDATINKHQIVRSWIGSSLPRSIYDCGANTGSYSRIASDFGIPTVAFDHDFYVVEAMYRRLKEETNQNILPLHIDFTNPSPLLGWAQEEREGLLERGPVEMAMALALIHHIAIGQNVPLPRISKFFAQLCNTLIIEMVPKEDSQVQRLLAAREDIFPHYTLEGFESAFSNDFEIKEKKEIVGSCRTLYLMSKIK
jgi:ribosomal protein L11 methylase PrmA